MYFRSASKENFEWFCHYEKINICSESYVDQSYFVIALCVHTCLKILLCSLWVCLIIMSVLNPLLQNYIQDQMTLCILSNFLFNKCQLIWVPDMYKNYSVATSLAHGLFSVYVILVLKFPSLPSDASHALTILFYHSGFIPHLFSYILILIFTSVRAANPLSP